MEKKIPKEKTSFKGVYNSRSNVLGFSGELGMTHDTKIINFFFVYIFRPEKTQIPCFQKESENIWE